MRKQRFGMLGAGLLALAAVGCIPKEREFLPDNVAEVEGVGRPYSKARAFTIYDPTGKAVVHRNFWEEETSKFADKPAAAGDYTLTLELAGGKFVDYQMDVEENGGVRYRLLGEREK